MEWPSITRVRSMYRGFNEGLHEKFALPVELSQKIADMSDLCTALKLSSVRHSNINMHQRIQSLLLTLTKMKFVK